MLALPEIVLACAGLAILMFGVLPRQNMFFGCTMASIGALVVTAALVLTVPDGVAFGGQVISDGFARFVKILVLLGAAIGMLLALDFNTREQMDRFEYPVLLLFATLGMLILVGANDFMTVYIGLELLSLSLYVVAAFNRDNEQSAEAGLKYFVLGALASGLFLYGVSLIYGFAGTTNFERIAQALSNPESRSQGLTLGLVFILAGLAFKVSAVPFHMWTPDVYEGAPTPVTAFFAAAPKVAAVALLTRVLAGPFGEIAAQWQQVIVLVSLGSMILGAIAAVGQRNIKRLMAYSSIGHVGYALMGLAVASDEGLHGVMVYMAIYLVMNLGAFAVLIAMRRQGKSVSRIEDLAGLGKTDPAMAMWMTIFMFSMAGIPPLAGFFGKLYVFLAAVQSGFWTLAVVGVLTSVISAFYYLRVVKVMYFDEAVAPLDGRAANVTMVMGISGLFTTLFFLMPAPLLRAAQEAVAALLG